MTDHAWAATRLADLMDAAEYDVLAHMGFPAPHRAKISSTNLPERVNGETKRRSDVLGKVNCAATRREAVS